MSAAGRKRILAVASGGGHWIQLARLRPALEAHDVAYVTTDPLRAAEVGDARFYAVRDASRWSKLALIGAALRIAWIVLRERPDVLVSTGAAPGYLALRMAGALGARTVWIDSLANVDELSLSGRLASAKADVCLTQWPHLVEGRISYAGAVL